MAVQNETEQLTAAWRALDHKADGKGWQVIDISSNRNCTVMAGRKGTGNEESLLVGISGVSGESDSQLPRGQGFLVSNTEMPADARSLLWISLVRKQSGPLPIFTSMAADLISLLVGIGSEPGTRIYAQLIARIKAWQHFMSRDRPQLLAVEEEVGLAGELVVLRDLIFSGMPEHDAIEAWVGPEDGLHDFIIGTGGVEAKSTVAPSGFIARVGNLDQLDNSLFQPLYLGTTRFRLSDAGKTLPEMIEELLAELSEPGSSELLICRLASAGYLDAMRGHYTRKFQFRELSYRLVSEGSPRLTRSSVPKQVLEARYSLDVDAFPIAASTFSGISENLRMKK